MKRVILLNLKTRYQNPSVSNKACFLDSRFKTLPFFSESKRKQLVSKIQIEAEALKETNSKEEPPEKRQKSALMSLLDDIMERSVNENTGKSAKKEIEKYSCINGCSDGNLYIGGNAMKHSFPFLQNLQKSTFAFPLLQWDRREHLVQQGMLSTRNDHAYFPIMLIHVQIVPLALSRSCSTGSTKYNEAFSEYSSTTLSAFVTSFSLSLSVVKSSKHFLKLPAILVSLNRTRNVSACETLFEKSPIVFQIQFLPWSPCGINFIPGYR